MGCIITEKERTTLTFETFQEFCNSITKSNDRCDNISYLAIAINEEAGEVAGHVKKMIRDDYCTLTDQRRLSILKECGDVMYYLGAMCHMIGFDLRDAAQSNMDKYQDRKARGVLHGSGDDR